MSVPSSQPRAPSEFQHLWQGLALDEATLHLGTGVTLAPPPVERETRRTPATLPLLQLADTADVSGDLQLGEPLGQGGMGLVRAAVQQALGREVAVKTVRPDVAGAEARRELLREARLTGQLEHPNIVPVHVLGVDAAGEPVLVMKRVEGTVWRDLLADSGLSPKTRDAEDRLERHLRVLGQVCNAVHYAHSKGIVHRDLKPENVMVGAFGEVYLLDWGVALRLDDAAAAPQGIAGTPAWMAPEMVDGRPDAVDARTDVYLLGGLLHAILTGRPRHEGPDLFAVLYAAWRSEPPVYGPDVPAELADLCRRAMHPDPATRPQSALAFRDGLEAFLRHRDSTRLSAEAVTRLEALTELLATPADATAAPADDELDAQEAVEIYSLFAECRFGFQQALRAWPDNAAAQVGMQDALQRMARHEIAQGDYRAAAVLVTELEQVPRELQWDLDNLGARLKQESQDQARLQRIGREWDADLGKGRRAEFVLAIGIVWAILPAAFGTLEKLGLYQIGYGGYLGSTLFFTAFCAAGLWLGRREFLQNRVNRGFARMIGVAVVALLSHRVTVWLQGVPVPQAIADDLLLFFLVVAGTAATVDVRLFWGASVYLVAAFAGVLWRDHISFVTAVANLLALSLVALAWRPMDAETSRRRRLLRKLERMRAAGGPDGPEERTLRLR